MCGGNAVEMRRRCKTDHGVLGATTGAGSKKTLSSVGRKDAFCMSARTLLATIMLYPVRSPLCISELKPPILPARMSSHSCTQRLRLNPHYVSRSSGCLLIAQVRGAPAAASSLLLGPVPPRATIPLKLSHPSHSAVSPLQVRSGCIFQNTSPHLKMLGELYDRCHDTLEQFQVFISANLTPAE